MDGDEGNRSNANKQSRSYYTAFLLNDICIKSLPCMTTNSLHACLIPIPNHYYIRILSRNILDKLFRYSFDSRHALTVATEQPMNNAPQLSCCRAAVYR